MPSNIQQVRNLTESAREFLWEFIIPSIPGAVASFVQEMTLRARRAAFPGTSITNTPSWFKGVIVGKHPSRRDFPRSITITLEEGLNLAVLNTIITWADQFRDPITGVGAGEAGLKVPALLRLLNHANEVIGSAQLYGVYPETVPDRPLGYEGDALLTFDITFSYDYWVLS